MVSCRVCLFCFLMLPVASVLTSAVAEESGGSSIQVMPRESSENGGHLASEDGGHLASKDWGHLASEDLGHLASEDWGHLASEDDALLETAYIPTYVASVGAPETGTSDSRLMQHGITDSSEDWGHLASEDDALLETAYIPTYVASVGAPETGTSDSRLMQHGITDAGGFQLKREPMHSSSDSLFANWNVVLPGEKYPADGIIYDNKGKSGIPLTEDRNLRKDKELGSQVQMKTQTHGRKETRSLIAGQETLPQRIRSFSDLLLLLDGRKKKLRATDRHARSLRLKDSGRSGQGLHLRGTDGHSIQDLRLRDLSAPNLILRSKDYQKRAVDKNRKRSKARKAEVELLVVVENSIFRKFLARHSNNHRAATASIRRYYGMVIAMVNERFQTIQRPLLSIGVSISGILIAESRQDSGWLEKMVDWSQEAQYHRASVDTDQALLAFHHWIRSGLKELPKFDHAMIFSGYRLTNRYNVTVGGKAYLGTICEVESGNSVSIVSDTGDFQCVKIAAHELAHSLGSVHDGEPGFESCPKKGNYIMSPVATQEDDKLKNAFYFSSCSIDQMKKVLRSKKAACVRDAPSVFYSYDLQRVPPGRLISLDEHCQLVYGPESSFCNDRQSKDSVCGQLWCRDSKEKYSACRTSSYLTALPGTTCSLNKSCHLGECLDNFIIQDKASQALDSALLSSSSDEKPELARSSWESQLSSSQRELDNAIPMMPQAMIRGRIGRPSTTSRGQQQQEGKLGKTNSNRRKSRQRNKSRRKGRCKVQQSDMNAQYCRGLISLNPTACNRRAVLNYCCLTCSLRR